MKSLLSLLVGFLLSASLVAQTEAEALVTLKKAFGTDSTDARVEAIRGLAGLDSEKVAKSLVKAYVGVDEAILALSLERAELLAELTKLQRGKEFEAKPSYPRPIYNRINEIKPLLGQKRQEIDDHRTVQSEIRTRISNVSDQRTAQWLVKNVLASKKHSLPLKLAVSRLAGGLSEDMVADLERVFAKARRPSQILALLEGIAFAGKRAQSLAPQVIKLLKHKEGPVRERAAATLGKLAIASAIEPLIELLAAEEGRSQETVAKALAAITRQDHGVLVDSWRRWWADEKDKILSGETELGGGMFERRAIKKDMGYYFDIAMEGKSIMYIIDSSGSMKELIKLATGGDEAKEQTRLEACKAELIGALGRLEPKSEFNVIWYNDTPHLFSEKMVQAKGHVKQGQDWVAQLKPASSTNIYDSLKMSFDLAGQGSKDKYYGVALDTIFLLTDGTPTKPDGKVDSTDKILEAVRDWNALKRITIHAIGIGKNINTAFLEQLARENNGEFRQY